MINLVGASEKFGFGHIALLLLGECLQRGLSSFLLHRVTHRADILLWVKSSQELLPVWYKASYLSRRCAFANHNSLLRDHWSCEALVLRSFLGCVG